MKRYSLNEATFTVTKYLNTGKLVGLVFFGLMLLSAPATAQIPAGPQFAVFPFVSDDPRLGVAVADRLTHSFREASIPPELALGLVPPLVLQAGNVLSPLDLLGDEGTGSRFAAAFLRETLAVEAAVTGRVRLEGNGLELELFIARAGGARSFIFRAPAAFPERLLGQAQGALAGYAGLTPKPDARLSIDLSSPYGTFVDGLIALGSGFPEDATPLLNRAGAALRAEPRWRARADVLEELLTDRPQPQVRARVPLLAAVVALNTQPFEIDEVRRAFAASDLPLAALWQVILEAQSGDVAAARRGFGALTAYPYGSVQALLYRYNSERSDPNSGPNDPDSANPGAGSPDVAATLKRDLQKLLAERPEALSVPIGGLFLAQGLGDADLELRLAGRLTELAPEFAYAYERLSQLAFDRDDPAAAAVALRTASRLEPQSDLYWTNLGWAYYLLGVLGESEAASRRAVAINPDEFIALYNLGLVEVVTGRLGVALETYAEATTRDLQGDDALDPAAVADLQAALALYPEVPGVHYALGTLLELVGEIDPAAAQFERYAARGRGPRVAEARERVAVLRAPPPPLTITPGAQLGVGAAALAFAEYLPGDLLYARFELSTPGDALPVPLETAARLRDEDGNVVAETAQTERTPLPPDTVAVELEATLPLPRTLLPGRYTLELTASARGRTGRVRLPVTVSAASPSLARQLVGRGITLRDLSAGQPLYPEAEVSDSTLLQTLLGELALAAGGANDTLPEATTGRFSGQPGAALFSTSGARDVRDFLAFMLEVGANTDGTFAELYARWALEGAPVPQNPAP